MVNPENKDAYESKFDRHLQEMSFDEAAKYHVGGIDNYHVVGALERRLLEQLGLADGHYLIDLGSGSGRLAVALSPRLTIQYLGLEIVERLVQYCREQLPAYRFEVPEGFAIPEADGQADYVAAFSLFTHLLHEQGFLYMQDAMRVLKPGGKLVLSFLGYRMPGHRTLFLNAVKNSHQDRPLIVFSDREGLRFFGEALGVSDIVFFDGDERFIEFPEPQTMADGKEISGLRQFGQSVCVMTK